MRDLPNPFNFGQPEPSRFVLDEAAFMAEITEPPPTFLALPPLHLDRELGRTPQRDKLPSLSLILRELCGLADRQDLGVPRS